MKRIFTGAARPLVLAAALLTLASPAIAFDCNPGRYVGKSWSVNEAIHGKDVTLVVKLHPAPAAAKATGPGGICDMRFSIPSAGVSEIWELSGKRLFQRELDPSGKEKLSYGATLEVREGVEGYYVDCRGGGKCDGGADPRNFWRIENKGKRIVYSYWGVNPAAAGDAKARKRAEYSFELSP